MQTLMKYIGKHLRHPKQIHRLNEADSEILCLDENYYLATTIDSIAEEISTGLYRDPYTMGWVCAQASLSDLAAVGVEPLGVLFSTQWSSAATDDFKKRVFQGFKEALEQAHTFLLGGDSGTTDSIVLTSVAFGVSSEKPCTRAGMEIGDFLCITGKTGCGPALAFRFLKNESESAFKEINFRPSAPIKAGKHLRKIASSMIDSSDGLLSALSQLQSVNQVGFELEWNPNVLDPDAIKYCQERQLPLWLLWAGEHGDFQILATIPEEKLNQAQNLCSDLQIIGKVVEKNAGVSLNISAFHSPTGIKQQKKIDLNFFQLLNSGNVVEKQSLGKKFENVLTFVKQENYP